MYIVVVRIAGSGTSDMLRRAMGNIKCSVKSTASRGSNTEIAMEVYIPKLKHGICREAARCRQSGGCNRNSV